MEEKYLFNLLVFLIDNLLHTTYISDTIESFERNTFIFSDLLLNEQKESIILRLS